MCGDLCFNVLETFHFIQEICFMLKALIKEEVFYNLILCL